MELVTPGIGLLFWMTLSFLFVIFILGKFAWKPVLGMIKDRENSIASALEAADKAKAEMENLQKINEDLIVKAKEEASQMVKDAIKIRDSIVDGSVAKAQEEANKKLEQARQEIQNEKNRAMSELKSEIGKFSIEIAEKILRKELANDDKQKEYIDTLLKDMNLN
ncbi:MAG: F0F1 ATP synthase subunit B [Bacteroidota bacterium]|nr:F0F1 ATP synthase subunit B [Bacteroidota bacterium]